MIISNTNEQPVRLESGNQYLLVLFEPDRQIGDYVIGAGTVEDFSDTSLFDVISSVARIKLGLVGGLDFPYLDFAGLFLAILGLAGGIAALVNRLLGPAKQRAWLSLLGLGLFAIGFVMLQHVAGIGGVQCLRYSSRHLVY